MAFADHLTAHDEQGFENVQLERAPARRSQTKCRANVGGAERTASIASGAVLAFLGAGRRDLVGLLIAGVGGGLIYRGATGRSRVYDALGVDTTDGVESASAAAEQYGTHVARSFLVDKPLDELYAFWRNFENLPKIMTHLKSVQVIDDRRSHWIAKAPRIAGGEIQWDAEIIAEELNRRIDWCSTADSDVDLQGSVEFFPAPRDRGTAVRVVMDYVPPAGRFGKWLAPVFNMALTREIREDLRNFKRMMEVGELARTEGQPQGTCMGSARSAGS